MSFALSTDYGVLLMTRIKEARDAGRANREAIAVGLEHTGRVVTASAVLLAVAIGAFATSKVIFLKEIGLGATGRRDGGRVRRPLGAGAVADGAARRAELVVAGAAAPAPRAHRARRRRRTPATRAGADTGDVASVDEAGRALQGTVTSGGRRRAS